MASQKNIILTFPLSDSNTQPIKLSKRMIKSKNRPPLANLILVNERHSGTPHYNVGPALELVSSSTVKFIKLSR